MNKFYRMTLAAMLGTSAFALPGGSSSASAIALFRQDAPEGVGNVLLQDATNQCAWQFCGAAGGDNGAPKDDANSNYNRRSWNKRRDGDRFRSPRGEYRHYHKGYYYRSQWWILTVPAARSRAP